MHCLSVVMTISCFHWRSYYVSTEPSMTVSQIVVWKRSHLIRQNECRNLSQNHSLIVYYLRKHWLSYCDSIFNRLTYTWLLLYEERSENIRTFCSFSKTVKEVFFKNYFYSFSRYSLSASIPFCNLRGSFCIPSANHKVDLLLIYSWVWGARSGLYHYENTPIQIYRKFTSKNYKIFRWKTLIFFIFLLKNIDCGYSLEPPRRGGSNEYPQSMFWAEIIKIMYTPINPSFTI